MERYLTYLKKLNEGQEPFWKLHIYSDGSGYVVDGNDKRAINFPNLSTLNNIVDAFLAPKCQCCGQKLPKTQ